MLRRSPGEGEAAIQFLLLQTGRQAARKAKLRAAALAAVAAAVLLIGAPAAAAVVQQSYWWIDDALLWTSRIPLGIESFNEGLEESGMPAVKEQIVAYGFGGERGFVPGWTSGGAVVWGKLPRQESNGAEVVLWYGGLSANYSLRLGAATLQAGSLFGVGRMTVHLRKNSADTRLWSNFALAQPAVTLSWAVSPTADLWFQAAHLFTLGHDWWDWEGNPIPYQAVVSRFPRIDQPFFSIGVRIAE